MDKIRIGQIGIGHNHGASKMAAIRKFSELFVLYRNIEDNGVNGSTLSPVGGVREITVRD